MGFSLSSQAKGFSFRWQAKAFPRRAPKIPWHNTKMAFPLHIDHNCLYPVPGAMMFRSIPSLKDPPVLSVFRSKPVKTDYVQVITLTNRVNREHSSDKK